MIPSVIQPQHGIIGDIAGVITTIIPGPIDDIIVDVGRRIFDKNGQPSGPQPPSQLPWSPTRSTFKPETWFAPQQEPIVQGDLNPCPSGQCYRQNWMGRDVCEPCDYNIGPTGTPNYPAQPQTGGGSCGYLPRGSSRLQPTQHQQTGQACCPPGYHLNKTTYFLKDGTCVPARSACVKNRMSFNPGNGRSSKRAARRLVKAVSHHNQIEKVLKGVVTRSRRTPRSK